MNGEGVTSEYQTCPVHGDTLTHSDDQDSFLGEFETREHLECSVGGCGYEVWE